jgi:hypothetical protein
MDEIDSSETLSLMYCNSVSHSRREPPAGPEVSRIRVSLQNYFAIHVCARQVCNISHLSFFSLQRPALPFGLTSMPQVAHRHIEVSHVCSSKGWKFLRII